MSIGNEMSIQNIGLENVHTKYIESDEILLSWRILKNLGVIDKTFPDIQDTAVRTATTTAKDSFAHVKTEEEAKLAVTNLMGEYKPVFKIDGHLRTMKGEPMQIHFKPNMNIIVMNVCTPRKTPLAYLDAAKKKLTKTSN